MKYLIYSIILAFNIINVKGQELKKVYSVVKEVQTEEWYKTQQELWKAEVDKDNKNAVAWENYYNAARALKNLSWKEPELNKKRIEFTHKIAKEAVLAIPDSYQGNLIFWRESGNDPKEIKYLEKAYKLNSNNEEVLVNMLTQAKLMGKENEYSKYCKEYYKTNDISSGLLNWGYNLLSEVDERAIILTAGDNDTYPGWLMQENSGIRTDVEILNYGLLGVDDYREKVFEKIGLPALNFRLDSAKTQKERKENHEKIIDHIFQYSKRPIYVANSAITYFQEKFEEKLHLTGLTYKYSEKSIDNISLIIRNFDKRYLLDYLRISFSFNVGNKVAENAQGMYLPALIKLYKHYKNTEQSEKLKEVKELLLLIGERTGSSEEVNEILDGE
jgi:hypothetical protein